MYKYAQTNIQLYNQLRSENYSFDSLRELSSAYNLASLLFSAQYRANGKPFVCHLVGTASILAAHDAPWPAVLAGLLHAAYAEGNFGSVWPNPTDRQRKFVRDVIGSEAEQLIAAYTNFKWSADVAEKLVAQSRSLDDEARCVVLMRIANELEEAITGDILFEPPVRRTPKARSLQSCAQLAENLGNPKLASELKAVCEALPTQPVLDELIIGPTASFLRPPLSHRARLGPFFLQSLKKTYHASPPWLRGVLRAAASSR